MEQLSGQVIIYNFTLKAISPLYFGDSQEGELIMDVRNKPILLGNSIGGALREYLKKSLIDEKIILKYMGGAIQEDRIEKTKGRFRESRLYISDGIFHEQTYKIETKEGTAIDPEYGTAKKNQKYTLQHLGEGAELSFSIECNEWEDTEEEQEGKLSPKNFEKLIGTWVRGIGEQKLLLGGQKSNGFGRFVLKELRKTVFLLENSDDLDNYIFNREEGTSQQLIWTELDYYDLQQGKGITFSMEGHFPYGVYQGFAVTEDNEKNSYSLTGLKKKQGHYFLPATSLKGLLRNEVHSLINRMIRDSGRAKDKCEEIFGGIERRGKLIFSDICIEKEEENKKEENQVEKNHFIYIKIDRLTGGAYPSALKHQKEIQGNATIQFDLREDRKNSPYIFPLIYVMRKIGIGLTPLGGRTAIGLGEFAANKINISSEHYSREIKKIELLSKEEGAWKWLDKHFESFKRWCNDES